MSKDSKFVPDVTVSSQLDRGFVGGLVAGKTGTLIGVASALAKTKECKFVVVSIFTSFFNLRKRIIFLDEDDKGDTAKAGSEVDAALFVHDINVLIEKNKEKQSVQNSEGNIADNEFADDKDELSVVRTPAGAFWQISFTHEGIRQTIILGKNSSLSYEDALQKSANIKALFQKGINNNSASKGI